MISFLYPSEMSEGYRTVDEDYENHVDHVNCSPVSKQSSVSLRAEKVQSLFVLQMPKVMECQVCVCVVWKDNIIHLLDSVCKLFWELPFKLFVYAISHLEFPINSKLFFV